MSTTFESAVEQAIAAAEEAIDEPRDDGGFVDATVDGRCSFFREFKEHASESAGIYTLDEPYVTVDAVKTLKFWVAGVSTQHLHPEVAEVAYEAFAAEMDRQGYSCYLDVSR